MMVQIDELWLDAFKAISDDALKLHGKPATIYGQNGTGKSSLADAFSWLLTGRDSSGASDFAVLPLNAAGEVADHSAVAKVRARLLVDGLPLELERWYGETWTARRGDGEAVFDGHYSRFFVDGAEVGKGDFAARVAALCPSEWLPYMIRPGAFFTIPKMDRRRMLFRLVPEVSDRKLMTSDERFSPLLAALDGRGASSLSDLTKHLTDERKRLTAVCKTFPPRLDELTRQLREFDGLDFAAMRDDLDRAQDAAAVVRLRLDELDRAEDDQAKVERLRAELAQVVQDTAQVVNSARRADDRLSHLRTDWADANARTFAGGVCSACHQPLTGAALEAAHNAFDDSKRADLARIARDGQDAAAAKSEAQGRLETLEAQRDELVMQCNETMGPTSSLTCEQLLSPSFQCPSTGGAGPEKAQLQAALAEYEATAQKVREALAMEAQLIQLRVRERGLRAQARADGQALEDVEAMLSLAADFEKFKADTIADSINAKFQLIHWRLYTQQVNGELAPCCEPEVGGVPYGSINTGARVRAACELLEVLRAATGSTLPCFLDNSESLTNFVPPEGQSICLVVSEDDTALRVETKEEK